MDADVSSAAVSPLKRQERRSTQVQRMRKHQQKQQTHESRQTEWPVQRAEVDESDDVKQLRSELAEVQAALTREKRGKQKVNDQLEKAQKEHITVEREMDLVKKKYEQVSQIVAASEAHNRADLQHQSYILDEQILTARQELESAEAELRTLNGVAAQKHHGKLQRDIANIRNTDDSKKLTAWKKKVASLENSVFVLRSEVTALKTPGGKKTSDATHHQSNFGTSNTDTDAALETQKKVFTTQLAKLQEDIVREARVAQETHSRNLDDVVKKNQSLNVEMAHLEQQRVGKDADARRLQSDVERLSKVVEAARKKRDTMEGERQSIVKDRELVAKDIEQLHVRVQDALVSLNQLIMMSSEAPQMHEKAWTQERAGLQANLNATQQRSKKLEQDIQSLESKVETLKQDVILEGTLCDEEAESLKQLDKVRVTLQHVVQQQALAKNDDSAESSQKERIIQDLEGATRTERRQLEEMKALNDRLEKKIIAAKSLLQKHGFDI